MKPHLDRPRVLVLNRSYWPDVEATGQLLTELCEDLSRHYRVTVIAGRPNYSAGSSTGLKSCEWRNGVEIIRVRNRPFRKASIWSRAAGLLSYLLRSGWEAYLQPRPDVIVAESDPPVLGMVGVLLRWWHGCRMVNYLQDLHPEIGLALGRMRPGALATTLRWVTQRGLKGADRVVVLGEDMRRRVLARGVSERAIEVVPNWSDTRALRPGPVDEELRARWGVQNRFVVMYSGNLGLSQNLDQVLIAASLLRDEPVSFVFAGEGASKDRLQARTAELGLANVRFLPYAPKDRLRESLASADLHLVTLQRGLAGYIVPSKLYGILAVGRPYIAAVDADSEVASITTRYRCGVLVPPDAPTQLASAIRDCVHGKHALGDMGRRGRELAEREFDRLRATEKFRSILEAMTSSNGRTPPPGSARSYRAD